MGYLTMQDLQNLIIRSGGEAYISKILNNLISEDLKSAEKKSMTDGNGYYRGDHKILDRKMVYYLEGVKYESKNVSNNKVVHEFHTLLVNQKVSYLAAKPVTIAIEDLERKAKLEDLEDPLKVDPLVTEISDTLGFNWPEVLNEWIKGASNKGHEIIQVYIDKDSSFKYVIIPAEQCILVYDSQFQQKLEQVIRYWEEIAINQDGTQVVYKRVEWWTEEVVTFYKEKSPGEYELDPDQTENPRKHFQYITTLAGKETAEPRSWGTPPFVVLWNNAEGTTDLNLYKALIDDYDLNVSDFSNTLADIQDLILVIKNYDGANLAEFLKDLKTFKAIKVTEGGGVEPLQSEIPNEPRDSHLNRTEDNIFTFGMGINMKIDKFGSNPTGIALKFMYSLLDLKANALLLKARAAMFRLMEFMKIYGDNYKDTGLAEIEPNKIKFTFNKTVLINETETITSCGGSQGIISDETIRENHPWVEDTALESKRMQEQKEAEPSIDLDYEDDSGKPPPVEDNQE